MVIAFFEGKIVGIQPLGWYVLRENNAEFDTKVNRSEDFNMPFQNGPGVSSQYIKQTVSRNSVCLSSPHSFIATSTRDFTISLLSSTVN